MFSTPLICCSSGATTVAATTSALAPGYWPLTLTTGGAISGYWATGRPPPDRHRANDDEDDRNDRGEDRPVDEEVGEAHPRSRSIGVDLKAGGRCRSAARLLRRNLCAWPRSHEAVDDDVVVGRQTLRDGAQAIDDP